MSKDKLYVELPVDLGEVAAALALDEEAAWLFVERLDQDILGWEFTRKMYQYSKDMLEKHDVMEDSDD